MSNFLIFDKKEESFKQEYLYVEMIDYAPPPPPKQDDKESVIIIEII